MRLVQRHLVTLASWLALALHATAAVLPIGASEDLPIAMGGDLLEVSAELNLELPAGFFAPGSLPWEGTVSASSAQLGTLGAFEVGTTNMVLERLNAVTLSGALPSTSRVRVSLSRLALTADSPILISASSQLEKWLVTAHVSEPQAPSGWYDLTRTTDSGGTFSASIPIRVTVVFECPATGTRKKLDGGVVTLWSNSGTWTTVDLSPTSSLQVAGIPLGAALSGELVSPLLSLSILPSSESVGRPGPGYIDPTATILTSISSLGRGCSIGANAVIESGAVIGPFAVVGEGARVGSGVIVGDHASIGAFTVLSSGAVVDSDCVISSDCFVGSNAVIGPRCNLASSCSIGDNTVLRGNCILRRGCTVGDSVLFKSGVLVGSAVTVADDLEIAAGAIIAKGVQQTVSVVAVFDGTQGWTEPLPVSSAGAVQMDSALPNAGPTVGSTSGLISNSSTPDPNNPPPGYGGLGSDIGTDIAPPPSGTGQPYSKSAGYMCGWYAEQLRQKLEALGYNTTFTCISRLNSDWAWYKPWQDKWINGHALTDVHWPDGTATWIEAQWVNSSGIDSFGDVNGESTNPDDNGDGMVTYTDGYNGGGTTDGDMNVRVYDSRASAEAAGEDIPGN